MVLEDLLNISRLAELNSTKLSISGNIYAEVEVYSPEIGYLEAFL